MTRPWTAVYEAVRTSRKMARLPDDTCRLFYLQLLLVVDSYGCIEADPIGLDAKVWPALKKPEEETTRVVAELWRVGLIDYHGDGTTYWIHLPDWDAKAGSHLRRRGEQEFATTDATRVTTGELPTTPGVVRTGPGVVRSSPDNSRREKERKTEREEEGEEERERKSAGKPRGTRAKPAVSVVTLEELPERLRTLVFQTTLAEFLEFRRTEKRNPVTPIALRNLLQKLEPHGAAHAAASLRDSMANGWTGVFPEKRASGAPSALQPQPGGMREWFAEQDRLAAEGRTVDVKGGVL